MATTTSISFASVDSGGDKLNKAISDINPNATADKLVGFTKKLNGLTNNTYVNTTKIEKTELDTATEKTAVELKIGNSHETTISLNAIGNSASVFNFYNIPSTGRLVCKNPNTVLLALYMSCIHNANGTYLWNLALMRLCDAGTPMNVEEYADSSGEYPDATSATLIADTGDLIFYIEETDTHARSNDLTIHITA